MKIVGTENRSAIEPDPFKAWHRGQAPDKLLRNGLMPHPRGVWRLTHAQMNGMDFQRQLLQAARANPQLVKSPWRMPPPQLNIDGVTVQLLNIEAS